ncbi:hypothetical protein GW916_12715 [bacterium]|nr:hypothetical protein [bacterium]
MKKLILALTILGLGACATQPKDYTLFREENPKSILILPPLNESSEVMASYSFLSTVSLPVAEQGFYVFPVAVVDELMKRNGLPGPGEMHQVPVKKIKEIINPDAIMYIIVNRYGTKFHLIDSNTTVEATAKLVSAKTSRTLWVGTASANHSANSGQQDLGFLGSLVNAAVAQAVNDSLDKSREVATYTSRALFLRKNQGLLEGPYFKKENVASQ